MTKTYAKYIVPTMAAGLVMALYLLADGFFVGQKIGDAGLAAVNIAWPIMGFIQAVGVGIGMGGAVNISLCRGAGDERGADRALGNTFALMGIASVLITGLLLAAAKPILQLNRATAGLVDLAYDYIRVLAWGTVVQVLGSGVLPLLRNRLQAWHAMAVHMLYCVSAAALTGLFVMVLDMGVSGAALSVVAAHVVSLALALPLLLGRRSRVPLADFVPRRRTVANILRVGASPFGLTIIPAFTVFFFNRQMMAYGGNPAVAAYAAYCYVLPLGQLLLQGIGEGSQPMISFYQGAQDAAAVRRLRNWTFSLCLAVGLVAGGGILGVRGYVPAFFGLSDAAAALLHRGLPITLLALPFYGLSRASTAYLYAVKRTRAASLMAYVEALVLPLVVLTLPLLLGLDGVWWSVPLVQLLMSGVAAVLVFGRRGAKH